MNRTLIKKLILILLGNFILAFGVNCFMVSTGIIMGGATGIGLAVNKFTGINLSYVVWVLNFILFFLGLFFMGKAFAMSIILSTFFYPLCLNVLERIPGIMHLTDNLLLADIYGGVLVGLGIGLVVRQGASTGGLDIPPLIMQKKFGIPVGISLYVCDFTVLVMQAFFSTSDQVLYGILNVFLSSMVVNYVTVMGERKVQLLVISDKYEEIPERTSDGYGSGSDSGSCGDRLYAPGTDGSALCDHGPEALRRKSGDPDDRSQSLHQHYEHQRSPGAGALPSNEV